MGKFSLKKPEPVISEETALDQLMLLIERYNIDVDKLEGDIKKATEQTLETVLGAIMSGNIEVENISGEIKVHQHIKHISSNATVTKLTYAEMRGKDHAAMSKDSTEYVKMTQLLGSMCETSGGYSAVEQLRSSDRKIAEALALLFL